MKITTIWFTLVLALGCSKADKEPDKSAGAPEAAETEAAEPAAAEPAAPAVELVETDLSPRGDAWTGWTVKAPADVKIMDDLGDVRIAKKGFDLVLSQKKPDFAKQKKILEDGAKANEATLTFTTDTPELIEYTTKFSSMTFYKFEQVLTVGDQTIACRPFSGVEKAEELAVYKEACASVAKK